MRSRTRQLLPVFLSTAALFVGGPGVSGAPTSSSPPAEAVLEYRNEQIVTYRAWLQEGHLVVQVEHREHWHTYAMDNVERARERSGKDRPDVELPTVITLDGALHGGLRATGEWLQTTPREFSLPELRWYTWGFDGISYFALPVLRAAGDSADGGETKIMINGQACTAERCAMIDDLELILSMDTPPPSLPQLDLSKLIAVTTGRSRPPL